MILEATYAYFVFVLLFIVFVLFLWLSHENILTSDDYDRIDSQIKWELLHLDSSTSEYKLLTKELKERYIWTMYINKIRNFG